MSCFEPVWPAPAKVRAIVTTRTEGNLALHVGDESVSLFNRDALLASTDLPAMPLFMEQVHGTDVLVPSPNDSAVPRADAAFTDRINVPIVVMVADCLPVLLANASGSKIAVAHAGWRGLASGVIENTVAAFNGEALIAWLGPAIGPCHYEVDEVVRRDFALETGFTPANGNRYMLDLYAVATQQLNSLGVTNVFGGDFCTWCDPRFYSHRQSSKGEVPISQEQSEGRFAVIAWIADVG